MPEADKGLNDSSESKVTGRMSEVVIIRPGCTRFEEQNRIRGSLQLPLSELGQEQVRALVEKLSSTPLEVIYADASEPARSTAESIGNELGIPVKLCDGLRNIDQGLWQGLEVDEVRRKYPKAYRQWEESPETICPPEGEVLTDATRRVQKALRKPLKKCDCFGVVASDPLASLVAAIVQDIPLDMPEPIVSCSTEFPVQIVRTSDCRSTSAADAKPLKNIDPRDLMSPDTTPATNGQGKTDGQDTTNGATQANGQSVNGNSVGGTLHGFEKLMEAGNAAKETS